MHSMYHGLQVHQCEGAVPPQHQQGLAVLVSLEAGNGVHAKTWLICDQPPSDTPLPATTTARHLPAGPPRSPPRADHAAAGVRELSGSSLFLCDGGE
ncbi:unnamed protein product [Pleuronectes platessa]|uniref:Uncharacterized protein n=1 Tax=Pleuronectes platessa TaxID=8262 RepID=A0A9N7U3V5_PLEPL|nr:unnamed protein product [Pleuronectes platessa]